MDETDFSPLTAHAKTLDGLMGLPPLIMPHSHRNASPASEAARFPSLTGMSRTLYDNLAGARRS